MKMTFSDLLVYHQNLLALSNKTLPRKASVAVARNIGKMEKEVELHNKQRKEIAELYAVKKDGEFVIENNSYTFSSEDDKKAFLDEVKQLNEVELDVDIITFDSAELDRCDEVDRYDILTPREETSISWMITY